MKNNLRKQALLVASVAGLIAAANVAVFSQVAQAADGADMMAPCYGINKCKGAGDCGGKGNSCAGKNACKGMGFVKTSKEACMKIEGGSLTA